jgi:hypothetical protein
MSSSPNDSTGDPRPQDPALEDAPGQSGAHAAPTDGDDPEPVDPSSPALDTSSGMGDPRARGLADGSGPTGNLTDSDDDQPRHSDEDQIKQPTDFADEGYDDRQLDATRAAATERGDFGPATTEPSDR